MELEKIDSGLGQDEENNKEENREKKMQKLFTSTQELEPTRRSKTKESWAKKR